MWLRLLVPFTLVWAVLAVTAEGTALRHYRATWARELLALLVCIVAYLALWVVLSMIVEAISGSVLAGIVAASVLSLICVPVLLFVSFKLLGVKRSEAAAH